MTLSVAHAQRVKEGSKPLLYADSSSGSPALNREAQASFAAKYRVISLKKGNEFNPGGLKGFGGYPFRFQDPRSMRDWGTRGKVSYAFVVTPEGRVIEPRILHSTDERVSKYVLEEFSYDRYFPARFHDTPVYSLHAGEWQFGGQGARDNGVNKNGLGLQGYRDR